MENNIDFKPIFDYIDKTIDELKTDLESKFASKADIERILNAIDKFTKNDKDNSAEILVARNRIDNIETWVNKAAPKIGVPYKT